MAEYAETEMDRRQRERVRAVQQARPAAARDARPAPRGKRATGDRWAAFNAFVDQIAPRLTLAERAVWVVMFRHARDGVCETSVRMLATACNISSTTAQAALNRLQAAGLVRPIWKSRDRATASKYAMHHRPADCVGRLPSPPETVPMVGTVPTTNRTN